ncbi:bifunctional UDP-N-acetylmuramoyl-tripeptide:D-alanyl-D-alanine ligase/alanine racemase [Myroides sp. 1354]|uniref:bifunctional UDP-N-acetylmuramoyl-tripeptide:D-alanyl-D-alanine ligase/alanine racemase n=1 Tax=unclassified Myroides TaxID=2642485 RepID=UPI0025763071|nr:MULTISPECIES: bifunctional UDP-N-acetylmuramoyl-tripeptide:D-alanyl-D-alanine ligase/alanine racemase [unclassified Myroides]MDM1044046.1 bifunctional UDP-N-acetylmuramoyl-tripeptide:D-alanyl-D-alanine ligase/alanine racemase [Myroides sp. R163-1]MDM1054981.1 bifunctional UDP-N-acetylmuramoyl-tripeptide:D-alanyl-D-alanine ligase/alanine racemase [Myroides sp. 1354]MDM1068278.1 bifunctional UDP-N-acetylmuramoyl-tripeptide:D-alanyl-D-alanine ligase/alanine racemase [Myroides sp. 1372]
MNIDTANFCAYLQAEVIGDKKEERFEINRVSVDSRTLLNDSTTLFFALVGQNHDGHTYIEELIRLGITYFVVSDQTKIIQQPGVTYFVVQNTLQALQQAATWHRQKFDIPVVGITGSRGKTVVKEWLNFLLSKEYSIIKSPKSYNSQTGVPLSVFGMAEQHTIGLFEVGISTVNEMKNLQPIVQPTLGIITSITSEHQDGFETVEQKIQEKMQLFTHTPVLIGEKDPRILAVLPSQTTYASWSLTDSDTVLYGKVEERKLTLIYNKVETFTVDIPFTDEFSIQNCMTCILTMLVMGYAIETIQERIKKLYAIELRLQVKKGINNCSIIDDAYSSDFQSLSIALDFLEKHRSNANKTVILSDVFHSGLEPRELYRQVNQLLKNSHIGKVICIGEEISQYGKDSSIVRYFASTDEFLQKVSMDEFIDETILIKGARGFRFDKIVSLLEEKTHETVLEINLTAIRHNLNFYRSKLKPETKTMVMVKAFGYGHGSVEIAKLLEHEKVSYLGVAFADEGIALRKAGIKTNIIVMNPEISAFSAMVAYDLEPEIYSLRELRAFLQLVREKNAYQYPIHIKVETGMHRHGFVTSELDELIAILKHTNSVEVKSIFSHLSSSDMEVYQDFTLGQMELFQKDSSYIKEQLQIQPILHILNTSGIYNYSSYQMDMVRLGIGLYGIGNDKQEMKQLRNVGTLKTRIMQVKEIETGESVGYGRRFRATGKTKIATVPIGYADGIHRLWGSNGGYVLIENQKAPITGSICMDMLMVDVTAIDCREGDEVIIFGADLPTTIIAEAIHTIPYEIITSVSQRVKRIFFEE